MDTGNSDQIKTEIKIEVFLPILEDIAAAFSSNTPGMKNASWVFVQNNRTIQDFLKPHCLESNWDLFDGYFRQEKNIYLFIEEPLQGLVHREGKFWLFFDPKVAHSYFHKHPDTHRKYHPSKIIQLPPPSLHIAFAKQIRQVLDDADEKIFNQFIRVEQYLMLGQEYLPDNAFSKIEELLTDLIRKRTRKETASLMKDILNPGVSPTMLEKRLQLLYRVMRRFYLKDPDKDQYEALKKLLQPQNDERSVGLKFVKETLLTGA